VVRITDRGPFVSGRIIDVSQIAAHELGFSDLAKVCPVDSGKSTWMPRSGSTVGGGTGLVSCSNSSQPVFEPLEPVPRWRRRRGRLELEAVTVASMNELKRSRVVGSKIRTVTNAQHGRTLQFAVEQAHDAALAVFVERGCGFVERKTQPGLSSGDHTTPWACYSKVSIRHVSARRV
jgi:rare lipoprotein A (RlpA)-like double-psi beta-barrel protein